MTLPQSVNEVLRDHVRLECESIDRMYLNVYVPQLQRIGGVVWYLRGHLGQKFASTAAVAPKSAAFVGAIERFVKRHRIDVVSFRKSQRKARMISPSSTCAVSPSVGGSSTFQRCARSASKPTDVSWMSKGSATTAHSAKTPSSACNSPWHSPANAPRPCALPTPRASFAARLGVVRLPGPRLFQPRPPQAPRAAAGIVAQRADARSDDLRPAAIAAARPD